MEQRVCIVAESGSAQPWLLYGVLQALPEDAATDFLTRAGLGIFSLPIRLCSTAALTAVGSVLPPKQSLSQPSQADLIDYARIIQTAHERAVIAPLRFGSMLDGEVAVRAYLEEHRAPYRQLLDDLAEVEELAVRIYLATDIALAPSATETLASVPGSGSGAEYLRQRRLQHARRAQGEAVAQQRTSWVLTELAEQIRSHKIELALDRSQPVASLALLVRRRESFQIKRQLTAAARAASIRLSVSGPFPPYSFAVLAALPGDRPAVAMDCEGTQ